MHTRRSFIDKVSKGITFSALPLSALGNLDPKPGFDEKIETMNIGIIGAENSHTRAFGKLFNIDKKFPGFQVTHVWGETTEFAKDAMERGGIPNIVQDPKEMIGKVDALIVDHRHAKFHLEAAKPFVEAGIPSFIDKPFCYRLDKGKAFLEMARNVGTPVTSYSSIAHSYATFDMKEQLKILGEIQQVVRYGPVELDSKYGGIFFYGVHLVQPLLYLFGDEVERVRITKNGVNSGASLVFANGMLATLVFTTKNYGWQTFIETDDGIVELKSTKEKMYPDKNYIDMVNMFKTGKEPISHDNILSTVAVLEALEKSVYSEQWEKVLM